MSIFSGVRSILEEVMDIGYEEIFIDSYLVRDLDVESIDFLEIAVEINQKFKIDVVDNRIFLKSLRLYIENGGNEAVKAAYPYLREGRVEKIMSDYKNGPVIIVSDIVDYIDFYVSK